MPCSCGAPTTAPHQHAARIAWLEARRRQVAEWLGVDVKEVGRDPRRATK